MNKMAKETIIIFVYDTQLVQNETDDPATAILYFHPTWVSDQQKTALCGQLIGVFQCLKNVLKLPKVITLHSGKFFLKEYGRYILAVGTDRNIVDWLLEHRSNVLSSLISFYHKGIEEMGKNYQPAASLSAKLYHMFETYLKLLYFGGNIFTYSPTLRLPKSASNIFLEAMHTLQCCQESPTVLGGTLLYHNKIVATQLNADYSKRIVLSDPYRIKSPAEVVDVDFDLPLGVQLLEVYVLDEEYQLLCEESQSNRNIFQSLVDKTLPKLSKQAATKEPVLSAMKRDQSLLFTAVLEEDGDLSPSANLNNNIVPVRNLNRPKFLNLKSKLTESNIGVKEVPKKVAGTPLCGQGSVCSTPLTELNKVLYIEPLSICNDPVQNKNELPESTRSEQVDGFISDASSDVKSSDTELRNSDSESINSILSTVSERLNAFLHSNKLAAILPILEIDGDIYDRKKSLSLSNLNSANVEDDTFLLHKSDEINTIQKDKCKTIADPVYPIFKSNGLAASYSYYKEVVSQQSDILSKTLIKEDVTTKANLPVTTKEKLPQPKEINQKKENISRSNISKTKSGEENNHDSFEGKRNNNNNREHRKSLTLPLKSLTSDLSGDQQSPTSVRRHSSAGVQLTPLMSKLTIHDFEERSSGFCSRQTTPGDLKPYTPTQHNIPFKYKIPDRNKSLKDSERRQQKCYMFVYGQQDTVAVILLQNDKPSLRNVISKLYDVCSESLAVLEKQLCHCLETYPNNGNQAESDPYSFLCLDPDWDTVQRGGPWSVAELGTLAHLRRDFLNNNNLVEVLQKSNENVVYGCRLGDSEVYYQQIAPNNAGLPTPADAMGVLPLRVRRRMERNHCVILL